MVYLNEYYHRRQAMKKNWKQWFVISAVMILLIAGVLIAIPISHLDMRGH